MIAFLRVADAMEENNPELKVWVKQVREATYDIGDVLKLYMLRLGHRHGAGFCGFLRNVSSFIKTLKARHQIASEVQRMKSRVDDISKGHQRYHDRYELLNRCEGLPLAIVVVSGLLSTKDKSSVDEWDKIYRSLGAELEGNDKLLSMNKILSLSYIDLPHYLKSCFLYLSVFPEGCFIGHWRLIRLWMAEGFVEMRAGMTKEEVAEGYLNEAGGFQRLLRLRLSVLKGLRWRKWRLARCLVLKSYLSGTANW
ncbi:hypothetical protein ACSBR2_011248 [Camellia fascicularis]